MSTTDSDVESPMRPVRPLGDRHRTIFIRAMDNVLSSPIAEVTFGQIIDGLPLSDVAIDAYHGAICPGHPLLKERLDLSVEAINKAQQLRHTFNALSLEMNSQVIKEYLKCKARGYPESSCMPIKPQQLAPGLSELG